MTTYNLSRAIIAIAGWLAIGVPRVAAESGDLDPTFGTGGSTEMQMGQPAEAYGMALQSDGKIVVAGFAQYQNSDFAVVRYNANGAPDSTFGLGGKVTTPIGGNADYGFAVAVQHDGKIVVAGHYNAGSEWDPAIVRYLTNGTLDLTFGGGTGKWIGPSWLTSVSSVAVQIDGKILVAGTDGYRFWIDRLNADGSEDVTFGSLGSTWAEFGVTTDNRHNYPNAMAVQGDGRIVLAGWVRINGLEKFAIARFLNNGQLDPTFGTGGEVVINVGIYDNGANCVALLGNGKILVGGYSDNGSGQTFTLLRLTQFGSLDTTFGNNGVVTTAITGSHDSCTGLAIQSDGKILAAGSALWTTKIALVRYNGEGALDTTFGNLGVVTSSRTASDPSLALQGDGKILVAGSDLFTVERFIGPAIPEIAVEQPAGTDLTNGTARVDFGKAEVGRAPTIRTFTIRNAGTSSLSGLAVTNDGAHAGEYTVGPLGATDLAPGASTTFTVVFTPGALGSRTTVIHIASNDADENPFEIALEGTGVLPLAIVTTSPLPVGTVGAPYRLTLTASGGAATPAWSVSGGSLPPGLNLSSTGLLSGTPTTATSANFTVRAAGGGPSSATRTFDLSILGSSVPGALDMTFGSGGTLTNPIGSKDDRVGDMALQEDGKILVAGGSLNGNNWDFAVARYQADGSPDLTFGAAGKVITAIGPAQDYARSVAVLRDGRILVAGDSSNGTNSDFALVRYLANGALDTTFGSAGKVTASISGTSGEMGHGMAVQADGKILVAGYSDNGTVRASFALFRFNPDGGLDPTFGSQGKVTTAIGGGSAHGYSVAIQRDGRIVVAGQADAGASGQDLALVRYLANGELDTGFGSGGKVITSLGAHADSGRSVTMDGDDTILVAGVRGQADINDADIALVRYLPNGELANGFGSNGVVITDIGSGSDDAGQSVVVESDGKIVVAGSSSGGVDYNFALARYLPNGILDSRFGTGGKVVIAVGESNDFGWSVALQRDGKIVVAGDTHNGSGYDFALVRCLGTTEPEIAVEDCSRNNLTDGITTADFGRLPITVSPGCQFTVRNPSTATLSGLAVSLDGANAGDFMFWPPGTDTLGPGESTTLQVIFIPQAIGLRTAAIHITSNDADESPFDIALAGTVITAPVIINSSPLPSGMVGAPYNFTFSATRGTAPYIWSAVSALPAGLSLSTNGVLSGTPTTATNASFTVSVRDSDSLDSSKTISLLVMPALRPGDLDPGFGVGGKVVTPIGDGDDFGYSAALAADGKVLVAGYSRIGNNDDFALVRYLADGTLDAGFGTGGIVTTGVGATYDQARSVAVQSDGRILVAGDSNKNGSYKFGLVRYQPDGSLDTTFGSNGKVTNLVGNTSYGKTVMVQSNSRIVVAGEVNAGGIDYGVARWLADGTLDPVFGTGGVTTTDLGRTPNFDYAQGAALQADDKILLAGYASGTDASDFGLVRYLGNGTLDASFGSGGIVLTSFGSSADFARCVVVQSDGKILVTGEVGRDFGLARYLANGSLDTSFGNTGKVTTAIDRFEAFPRGMAVQSDGRIVVAGYTSNGTNNDFALARFNTNGTLDISFNNDGKLMTAVGNGHDRARSVVLQQDGKIVVAGESHNGTNYDFAVVRYLGSLEPEIAVEHPAGNPLIDAGPGINFGGAALGGSPVVREITLRNVGSASLTGLAIAKDGANAAEFAVEALPTTSLAPGASVRINVTFSPSAAGPRTAAIQIASNDADEGSFGVMFAGTGGGHTPLQAWRLAHFGNPQDSGDGADANDFDKDGWVNLLEYASGGDPKVPDAAASHPTAAFADGKFLYTFMCDARCSDLTYTVQATDSLQAGSWRDVARSIGGGAVSPEFLLPQGPLCEVSDSVTGLRRVTVTIPATSFAGAQGFLRVKILY